MSALDARKRRGGRSGLGSVGVTRLAVVVMFVVANLTLTAMLSATPAQASDCNTNAQTYPGVETLSGVKYITGYGNAFCSIATNKIHVYVDMLRWHNVGGTLVKDVVAKNDKLCQGLPANSYCGPNSSGLNLRVKYPYSSCNPNSKYQTKVTAWYNTKVGGKDINMPVALSAALYMCT